MTADKVYQVQINGQAFTIRISHPKEKYQYRASLTDALNTELGSGRWDTAEEAESALKDLARRQATRM